MIWMPGGKSDQPGVGKLSCCCCFPFELLVGFDMPPRPYLFVVGFEWECSVGCSIHWVDGGPHMRSLAPSRGEAGGVAAAALLVLCCKWTSEMMTSISTCVSMRNASQLCVSCVHAGSVSLYIDLVGINISMIIFPFE